MSEYIEALAKAPREHLPEALAGLSRAKYETIREELAQRLGPRFRVSALDKMYEEGKSKERKEDKEVEESTTPRKSQVTRLIEIAENAALFHDKEGVAYAELGMLAHREVWPVHSKAFKSWLSTGHYQQTSTGCNRNSVSDALTTIEARAKCHGDEREVYLRVAERDGALYVDLADDRWRCVRITGEGWEILDRSPVMFIRKRTSGALPMPERGGSINELWPFLNVAEDDRLLVAGWLLAALRPRGPYPVMIFQGEAETAKSTASRILRSLADPSSVPLKAPPKDERDFAAVACNGWVTAFDNLSGLQLWQSDAICRLSTGGGIAMRELYTNADEYAIELQRPVILNGIDDIACQPDLASRAIILPLQPIRYRKEETKLWEEFERQRPKIFGALLDGLSCALKRLPETHLDYLPRMADFARWASAAETSFGYKGKAFMTAYRTNIGNAVAASLEASSVAQAVISLMRMYKEWEGTASDLLAELVKQVDERSARDRAWPKGPNPLSNKLRRVAPALRRIRIDVVFGTGSGRRPISIFKRGETEISDAADAKTATSSVDEELGKRDIYSKNPKCAKF